MSVTTGYVHNQQIMTGHPFMNTNNILKILIYVLIDKSINKTYTYLNMLIFWCILYV